jgi:hypothetical protein
MFDTELSKYGLTAIGVTLATRVSTIVKVTFSIFLLVFNCWLNIVKKGGALTPPCFLPVVYIRMIHQ